MTSEPSNPKLSIWPFALADVLLVACAFVVYFESSRPLLPWQACLLVGSVAAGAWSLMYAFIRRDASVQAMARVESLSGAVAQIKHVDQVASQIASATAQWQSVQEYAVKVADTAKAISTSMSEETGKFSEALQKANDAEKNHLRVELDKLHRTEMDWLQASTRMLDHVHALYMAAQRSKMANLIAQLSQFQEACRDSVRRVGLLVLEARPGEGYDAQVHELPDPQAAVPVNAVVERTLATGYSYQGRLLRKVLVTLTEATPTQVAGEQTETSEPIPVPVGEPDQSQTPESGPVNGELGL